MAPEGNLGFCLILKSLLCYYCYKFDVDYLLFAILSFSAISCQTLFTTISAENCY